SALLIDPLTPTTLYAGISGLGVLKSTDAGSTWRAMNTRVSTSRSPPCPFTASRTPPCTPGAPSHVGTSVTLTAAASGSTFTGWSGEGCSGTSTCTVRLRQARSVTATFTLTPTTGGGGGGCSLSPGTPVDGLDLTLVSLLSLRAVWLS